MTKTVDEARELINNLASSNSNNCPEYDRSRERVSNPETRKLDALSDKLELLLRRDLKHVNRIDEIDEEEDDQEEMQYLNNQSRPTNYRINFTPAYRGSQGENAQGPHRAYQPRTYAPQGQGFQKPFNKNQGMQGKLPYIGERSDSNTNKYQRPHQNYARPQQNFQVQPAEAAPTPPTDSRIDELLQQILARQQRLDNMYNNLNVKLDGITNHVGTLKTNLEAITLHVRKLDTQVTQIAEAVKRSTGELPGKPEPNPRGREFVNSVTQGNGEGSPKCNTLKAQKQNLEEEHVASATTAFEDLNIARGTSSSRGGETLIERAELITQQPVIHDRVGRFRETLSHVQKGTSFEEAWERYSLKNAFTGISPKKELVERMYEMMSQKTTLTMTITIGHSHL